MKSKQRNYQIDVLKFACAICVFFSHTLGFKEVEKGTSVHAYFDHLGWISVHIFFVISGFLMVKNVKSGGGVEMRVKGHLGLPLVSSGALLLHI